MRLKPTYIRKEADSSNRNGTDMVPTERRLVDLGERKTATLIRVLDMDELVVEVGIRRVPARCLLDGSHGARLRWE